MTQIPSRYRSAVHTKETLLHFSSKGIGSKDQKNAFITAHYRHKNLQLAKKLDGSIASWDKKVNKVIRSLRWCSSVSLIEKDREGKGNIRISSKSCKNSHCAICARARSAKISNRVYKALQDKKHKEKFKGNYFYFLTLTVQHNDQNRSGIYLSEFNSYCNKLFRSKVWKENITGFGKAKTAGWLHSRECTFTENNYHIHSHTLITCRPLKKKVKDLEEELRQRWFKITGDSYIIRLDLIKDVYEINEKGEKVIDRKKLDKSVKEITKYGTKTGNFDKWTEDNIEDYGEWIIETKGANFINASGIFRGMGLCGAKSEYDIKGEGIELSDDCEYYIGKTSNLHFSKNPKISYGTKTKKQIIQKAYLKTLPPGFHQVTEFKEEIIKYLRLGKEDEKIKMSLDEWVEACKREKYERDNELRILDEIREKKVKEKAISQKQMKMFKQMQPRNMQAMIAKYW